MNVGRALEFVFDDEDWPTKILLGALLMLVPIFGQFAIFGYGIALIRNVLARRPRPLPAWDDVGKYFLDGLLFWLANIIYSLPILIIVGLFFIPAILPVLAGENEDLMAILTGTSVLLMSILGCISILYGILVWLLTPMIQVMYAVYDEFGAMLRIGEIVRLTFANIGQVLIAQGMMIVIGFVISLVVGGVTSVLGIIPICGWIVSLLVFLLVLPVGAWSLAFQSHLFGQVGLEAGFGPPAM